MWAKVPWYKDNTPRWHSLTLANYSFLFVFKNPNHPPPYALPWGWEPSHTSLSTLARLCYSTLFRLTGLFQDCSAQEDVWTFWKNHHFFSESIHRQFVLCVCVCVCVCARAHEHACSIVSDSLQPHGLLYPWNFPGKNAGGGHHSLFQGLFPMQGSNPCLLHPVFQGDSLALCHLGSPKSAAAGIPRQSPIQALTRPNPA